MFLLLVNVDIVDTGRFLDAMCVVNRIEAI